MFPNKMATRVANGKLGVGPKALERAPYHSQPFPTSLQNEAAGYVKAFFSRNVMLSTSTSLVGHVNKTQALKLVLPERRQAALCVCVCVQDPAECPSVSKLIFLDPERVVL